MLSAECTLEQAIGRLWYWQQGGTSFSCDLYSLFQKADPDNVARLTISFPVHALARSMWLESSSPQDFFKAHLHNKTEAQSVGIQDGKAV